MQVASGTALPFPDDSFDLVYCVAVMHHIADRRRRAADARRDGPGGEAGRAGSVWDHNPRNPYWRLLMARVPQDTGEERLIPEAEIFAAWPRRGRAVLVDSWAWSPTSSPRGLLGAAAAAERAGRAHAGSAPPLRPQRGPGVEAGGLLSSVAGVSPYRTRSLRRRVTHASRFSTECGRSRCSAWCWSTPR